MRCSYVLLIVAPGLFGIDRCTSRESLRMAGLAFADVDLLREGPKKPRGIFLGDDNRSIVRLEGDSRQGVPNEVIFENQQGQVRVHVVMDQDQDIRAVAKGLGFHPAPGQVPCLVDRSTAAKPQALVPAELVVLFRDFVASGSAEREVEAAEAATSRLWPARP